MKILSISIRNVQGLGEKNNEIIFLKDNTIILGDNQSGKTRFLNILYYALKNELEKKSKDLNTNTNSKITIKYKNEGKTYICKYEGEKLKIQNKNQNISKFATNPIFISSNNINLNELMTNEIQNELKETDEFKKFKAMAEKIANEKIKKINNLKINNESPYLWNKGQKMPKFKVEMFKAKSNLWNENSKENFENLWNNEKNIEKLENCSISIENEGDGFKKNITIQFLKTIKTNFVLIDEIENHLSKKTINEIISSLKTNLEDFQLIATSHRIEICEGIDSITSVNNDTITRIGAYINNEIKNDVIVVEGKNDLPIFSKLLELINKNKVIVVATNKEEAKRLSKEFRVKGVIDRDDNKQKNEDNLIKITNKRQLENYVPQSFIDKNPKLKGIKIKNETTIDQMVENSEFENKNNLKNYIANNVEDWLKQDNELIEEFKNWIE